MNIEFNSNTIMTIIMGITLLGGGYQYIETQIKNVEDNVSMLANYDDSRLIERVTSLEAKDVSKEFAVVNEKLSQLQSREAYDPTAIEKDVQDIKVLVAQIQTKLEGIDKHDHNGIYVRQENK